MRITLAVAVACLTLSAIAAANDATVAIRKPTDIPAQGLGLALTSLAKEFDFQVLYHAEVVGTLRTQGASGAMTAAEALEHVLSGTGLTYKYLDDRTVTIIPTASVSSQGGPVSPNGKDTAGNTDAKEGKKSSSEEFRVAQAPQGSSSSSPAVDSFSPSSRESRGRPGGEDSSSDKTALREIIVTAQKRSERLKDVPIPVTALTADTLADTGQVLLR